MPVIMDLLKRTERLLDILDTVAFKILVEIPSTPVALDESREWIKSIKDLINCTQEFLGKVG